MSVTNKAIVRKGRPTYVRRHDGEYPTEAPGPRAATTSSAPRDSYPTESADIRVKPRERGVAPIVAVVATTAQEDAAPQKAVSTAAAKASLSRHKELALHIAALLQLLQRSRPQPPAGEDVAESIPLPPAPEELRHVLDAIRDCCVAVNNATKFGGGAAGKPTSALAECDDDLNGFLAVVFLSTLFFANEAEGMLRDSLESAVDRLRAAEAHGREEQYHNAIVEAVNNVLLFTPLTAPPVWLLNGDRRTTATSQASFCRRGVAVVRSGEKIHESRARAANRRASVIMDAAAESAMEDVAAVVSVLLHKMDHPEFTADADDSLAEVSTETDGTNAEAEPAMVLEDDCIDYLSSENGSPSIKEQHWLDVWLSVLLKGYVHLAAAAFDGPVGSGTGVADDSTASAGDVTVAVGEKKNIIDAFEVPTLLPRPVWRSDANNAYAQFAVQLLAIFFTRGADGSLNYCARVHKLVKYYHHRLRQSDSGCAPIPTENAARPATVPSSVGKRQHGRGPNVGHRSEKETQTTATATTATAAMIAEENETAEDADTGRDSKSVLIFHPAGARSRSRARGIGRESDDSAATEFDEEAAEEEAEEEEEEKPHRLTTGYSRFHKCYTAAEDPEFHAKRRIPVDA